MKQFQALFRLGENISQTNSVHIAKALFHPEKMRDFRGFDTGVTIEKMCDLRFSRRNFCLK